MSVGAPTVTHETTVTTSLYVKSSSRNADAAEELGARASQQHLWTLRRPRLNALADLTGGNEDSGLCCVAPPAGFALRSAIGGTLASNSPKEMETHRWLTPAFVTLLCLICTKPTDFRRVFAAPIHSDWNCAEEVSPDCEMMCMCITHILSLPSWVKGHRSGAVATHLLGRSRLVELAQFPARQLRLPRGLTRSALVPASDPSPLCGPA